MDSTQVYIVDRESGDGFETDVFTSYELAKRWARVIGSEVREEPILDAKAIKDMTASYRQEVA